MHAAKSSQTDLGPDSGENHHDFVKGSGKWAWLQTKDPNVRLKLELFLGYKDIIGQEELELSIQQRTCSTSKATGVDHGTIKFLDIVTNHYHSGMPEKLKKNSLRLVSRCMLDILKYGWFEARSRARNDAAEIKALLESEKFSHEVVQPEKNEAKHSRGSETVSSLDPHPLFESGNPAQKRHTPELSSDEGELLESTPPSKRTRGNPTGDEKNKSRKRLWEFRSNWITPEVQGSINDRKSKRASSLAKHHRRGRQEIPWYLPLLLERKLLKVSLRIYKEIWFLFLKHWMPEVLKSYGWQIPDSIEPSDLPVALHRVTAPSHAMVPDQPLLAIMDRGSALRNLDSHHATEIPMSVHVSVYEDLYSLARAVGDRARAAEALRYLTVIQQLADHVREAKGKDMIHESDCIFILEAFKFASTDTEKPLTDSTALRLTDQDTEFVRIIDAGLKKIYRRPNIPFKKDWIVSRDALLAFNEAQKAEIETHAPTSESMSDNSSTTSIALADNRDDEKRVVSNKKSQEDEDVISPRSKTHVENKNDENKKL